MRGVRIEPPLSSYSSACVGATISTVPSSSFSNEVESRLAYLNSIKTYGYSYLKPLGIGRTMQNIIDEQNLEIQENGHATEYTESMANAAVAGTAENFLTDTNNINMNNNHSNNNNNNNGLIINNTDNSNTNNNNNAGIIFQDPTIDIGEDDGPQHQGTYDDDHDHHIDSHDLIRHTNNSTQPQAEGTGFTTNNSANFTGIQQSNLEVDLDAAIPDHDNDDDDDDDEGAGYLDDVFNEYNASNNDDDDEVYGYDGSDNRHADEGFMAAEEEYEDEEEEQEHNDSMSNNNSNNNNGDLLEGHRRQRARIGSEYYDHEIDADFLQLRAHGTRNISTSTRISSFNNHSAHSGITGDTAATATSATTANSNPISNINSSTAATSTAVEGHLGNPYINMNINGNSSVNYYNNLNLSHSDFSYLAFGIAGGDNGGSGGGNPHSVAHPRALLIHSDIYNLFSRNTTQNEEEEEDNDHDNSDMEMD